MDWSKMVKMTVPVGLCGWQQRGSLTINGRTTEFPVGVETELPEPVAERIKALIADAEEKAEHVQPLKPWMQYVTGADSVARWEPRLAYAYTGMVEILPETKVEWEYPDRPEALLKTPFQKRMESGHEYTVMWNGQQHKCIAQEMEFDEGSVAVNVEAEGYFMIIQPPEQVTASYGVSAFVHRQDEITSATFSITAMAETVKTLDPKYLPSGSGGGGVMMITAELTSSTGNLDNPDTVQNPSHTYEEVKAAVDAGKYCILVAEKEGTYLYTPMTGATDAGNGMAYGFAAHDLQIIVDKNGWMKH